MPVPQFLTGLGLATKIGLGAATTAAVLGGIGVAGALPAPAQASFDSTVETLTPFEAEDTGDVAEEVGEETESDTDADTDGTGDETDTTTTTSTTTTTTPVDDETLDEEPLDGPPLTGNFGAWVSEQARQGGVDGQVISAAAHARNEARKAARAGESTEDDSVDDADETTTDEAKSSSSGGKNKGPRGNGRGRNR